MAKLEILTYPHKILSSISKPITEINDDIIALASNMLETMYTAPGIGLAAPQVGILKRLIVIDVDYSTEDSSLVIPRTLEEIMEHKTCEVLINPEIISISQEMNEYEEGCLSVPGYSEAVKRPSVVNVQATLINGENVEFETDNLFATCIQHEIDHLDGKVFIDRISSLKRNIIKKKIIKSLNKESRL